MSEYHFARLCVDKAKLSSVDTTSSNPPPLVGIVLEKDGILVGWAAKGTGGEFLEQGTFKSFTMEKHAHAEQSLLAHFCIGELIGASAYVTLEPCIKRWSGASCTDLLISHGISVVHIANCDPNPNIGALAWRFFHEKGIIIRDFPGELRNEARRDNDAFFRKFSYSTRDSGSALFDYEADGGKRTLGTGGVAFSTLWRNRDNNSIYAVDYSKYNVCVAKHCTEFFQVDDPGRWLEDSDYFKPVKTGEIVIFQNAHGFALVKILQVTPRSETSNAKLHFQYELRYS